MKSDGLCYVAGQSKGCSRLLSLYGLWKRYSPQVLLTASTRESLTGVQAWLFPLGIGWLAMLHDACEPGRALMNPGPTIRVSLWSTDPAGPGPFSCRILPLRISTKSPWSQQASFCLHQPLSSVYVPLLNCRWLSWRWDCKTHCFLRSDLTWEPKSPVGKGCHHAKSEFQAQIWIIFCNISVSIQKHSNF